MRNQGMVCAAFWGGMTVLTMSACSYMTTWTDYSSALGRYSVSMPGTPQEETKPIPTPDGEPINMEITHLDLGKEIFWVAFMDFPRDSNRSVSIQQLMSLAVKGVVQSRIDGQVSHEQETTVNGVPCRDFQATGKYQSIAASMSGKVCFTGNRLYQVLAMGTDTGQAFDDKATQFLTSFQIIEKF